MLKYPILSLCGLYLSACAAVLEPKVPDPYIPAGSCEEIIVEMDAHKARIGAVGRLGDIRDVGVLGASIAIVAAPLSIPAAAVIGGAATAAASLDINTTGNEKRLDLLWPEAARRGCWK